MVHPVPAMLRHSLVEGERSLTFELEQKHHFELHPREHLVDLPCARGEARSRGLLLSAGAANLGLEPRRGYSRAT